MERAPVFTCPRGQAFERARADVPRPQARFDADPGGRIHAVRVPVKPLEPTDLATHVARGPRDRPGPPLP